MALLARQVSRNMTSSVQNSRRVHTARVALLSQAIESPIINGVRKPMKPGGMYRSIPFSTETTLTLDRLPRRLRRHCLQSKQPTWHPSHDAHRLARSSTARWMELPRLGGWHTRSSKQGSHTSVRQHGRLCQPPVANIIKSRRIPRQNQGGGPPSVHGGVA